MRFFSTCALLLLFSAGAGAIETGAEKTKIAGRVREIFEAKCVDCHGPELPRPKGKFGYVLDLKRVADNPDYIERGHPEKSELYKMVFNDEMPGEDANVPALTPEEKEIVKRWIELNAPEPAPAGGAERMPIVTIEPVEKPAMPIVKRAVKWVGNFHPVSTHFPIALMMVAVLAEALAWWTRREALLGTVRFLVVIAALGAVGAVPLGWADAYFANYTGQSRVVLEWHRWFGTGSAAWALVCAGLVVLGDCAEGSRGRQRFRGALLFGAALIGITGFLGAALIYGLDHYAWN